MCLVSYAPCHVMPPGSAAIYGLRGKANVRCFILYPKGRTSAIQERQMTTVPDKNVQCVAVEGTFDDCQNIVKACFQVRPGPPPSTPIYHTHRPPSHHHLPPLFQNQPTGQGVQRVGEPRGGQLH